MSRHTQRFTNRNAPTCGGSKDESEVAGIHRWPGQIAHPRGRTSAWSMCMFIKCLWFKSLFRGAGVAVYCAVSSTWSIDAPGALLAPRSFRSILLGFPKFSDRLELKSLPREAGAAFLAPGPTEAFGLCRGFPRVWQLSVAKEVQLDAGEESAAGVDQQHYIPFSRNK